MKPQSAKAKGRKLQQGICNLIVSSFPELNADDVLSRSSGAGGVDIMLSPLAQIIFPVSTECKNTKIKPGNEALEQAAYNTYLNTVPVVAWKPPRKGVEDTIAFLKYSDLIKLVKLLRNNVS